MGKRPDLILWVVFVASALLFLLVDIIGLDGAQYLLAPLGGLALAGIVAFGFVQRTNT